MGSKRLTQLIVSHWKDFLAQNEVLSSDTMPAVGLYLRTSNSGAGIPVSLHFKSPSLSNYLVTFVNLI